MKAKKQLESLTAKADAAFGQAAQKVVDRARRAGNTAMFWENGQPKELPPEALVDENGKLKITR